MWIWLKIIDTPSRWFPTKGTLILSHCHVVILRKSSISCICSSHFLFFSPILVRFINLSMGWSSESAFGRIKIHRMPTKKVGRWMPWKKHTCPREKNEANATCFFHSTNFVAKHCYYSCHVLMSWTCLRRENSISNQTTYWEITLFLRCLGPSHSVSTFPGSGWHHHATKSLETEHWDTGRSVFRKFPPKPQNNCVHCWDHCMDHPAKSIWNTHAG